LCIWTLVMESMSGVYLELVFLDGFLNFGQGIFSFALFGLDYKFWHYTSCHPTYPRTLLTLIS
jgi:hypothetical protein